MRLPHWSQCPRGRYATHATGLSLLTNMYISLRSQETGRLTVSWTDERGTLQHDLELMMCVSRDHFLLSRAQRRCGEAQMVYLKKGLSSPIANNSFSVYLALISSSLIRSRLRLILA